MIQCVGVTIDRTMNGFNSKHRLCMFGIPNSRDCVPNSVGLSKGLSRGSLASCVGCANLHGKSTSFSCIDGKSLGGGKLVSTCSVSTMTVRLRSKMDERTAPPITNGLDVQAAGRACRTNRIVGIVIGKVSLRSIGTLDFTLPCSAGS